MGVKDLWPILSPTCEKKSLWELEDKTIAIDLSAWVCDSQFAGSNSILNTYLRNLFFRTSYLLLLGARPVFVLEGAAPDLKSKTIRRRLNKDSENVKEKKVVRTRLNSLQKQCTELLSCLGVSCVRAPGEAEAFCAQMNMRGMACGVVTQDSDAFLYGAVEVYRNFQLAPHYTCDVYTAPSIESKLGLTRTKMVALSLLTGCDYSGGVQGVGKELALRYLRTVPNDLIFKRFAEWPKESLFSSLEKKKYLSSDTQLELAVREKALQTEGFPNLEVVEEFMCDLGEIVIDYEWQQPNVAKFVALAVKKLNWDEEYAVKKLLPLLTRWHLTQGGANCGTWITSILKGRTVRGKLCYEVSWESYQETTTEPRHLVLAVYPDIVQCYEDSKKPDKTKKTNGEKKKRTKRKVEEEEVNPAPNSTTSTLDKFITRLPVHAVSSEEEMVYSDKEEDFNLSSIINTIVTRPNSNPAVEHYHKYNNI